VASQTSPPSLLSRSRSSNGAHPHWGKAAAKRASGQTAGEIGTRLVGLLRRHTGRGPTKARASISSDLVLVTFSEGLTTAETHFAAAGLSQLVARARSVLYDLIRDDATAIVEELTGRKVVAYLTAQHDEPDIAILVFYLDARR
jgi:uncharacterized protein YbcI